MGKTKKELLDEVLAGILHVGQIKACGDVSKEGLLIDSRTPPDVDARIFSALCSTIMGAAEAGTWMKVRAVSDKKKKRPMDTSKNSFLFMIFPSFLG